MSNRPDSTDAPISQPPKGALLSIFMVVFVDFLGFGIVIPLLPFFVPDYKHHALQVTLLFSVFSICQFVGSPILGAISDRVGRRPVLIVSQVGGALAYLLLAAACYVPVEYKLAVVYISRALAGLVGGNVSTAQAYIADVTTDENRAKGMGMLGAAFGIGFTAGPAIGGILGHYNPAWPAYAAALASIIAALQTWLRLPESRRHGQVESQFWLHPDTFAPVLKNRVVANLLFISFVTMTAFVMMESTIGLFLNKIFGYEEKGTGYFFAYVGVVIIIVQGGLIGRMTRKFGEWPLAIVGPALVTIAMFVYVFVPFVEPQPAAGETGKLIYKVTLLGLGVLGFAAALNAVGRSLQQPPVSSLISKYTPRQQQGVVFGMYHGLSSLARVIGPILAGLAYPLLHNTGQFLLAALLTLICTIWTISLRAQAGQPPATAPRPSADTDGTVETAG